ncbi:MAG: DNA primase catalytic subunit PriS [Candidatus Micrarchaeota archaeon]|nr:DNA primase catalytic subunit PriS [Candidatus Micrarchaeota archaeon]
MPEFVNREGLPMVLNLIKEYYKGVEDIAPRKTESREFGFGNWDVKIAYRHFSFSGKEALKNYLVANPPPYVSYSAAYYKEPAGRPMEAKGWEGSELVFDLDVTDMNLSCHLVHEKSWVCDNCLESVKQETIKLIEDFLIPDFGFSDKDLEINFSGNRGYHVHVNRDDVLKLDSYARNQITEYIAGTGIEVSDLFPTSGKKSTALIGPKPTDAGWGGKIARNFLKKLNDSTDALAELGIDRTMAKRLYEKRALIEMGINRGNWDMVYIKNKAEFWQKISHVQAIMQSDKIDRNVTKDPSHLIRLPNSIHGETGLIAKKVKSLADLGSFDPMKDAIAFRKRQMTVFANSKYRIIMNGQQFGPYKEKETTVPIYAALYLYLKGLARFVF